MPTRVPAHRTPSELSDVFSEAITDKAALLQLIAERVSATTGAGCALRLLSADGRTLSAPVCVHPDPAIARFLLRDARPGTRDDFGALFDAVVGRRELVVLGTPRELSLPASAEAWMNACPPMTRVFVPLIARSRVIGVLAVLRNDGPVGEDDLEFVKDIAQRAALAIDNATLVADARRLADRLGRLTEVSQEFARATPDLPRLLGLIAQRMVESEDEVATITLLAADGVSILDTIGWHPDPSVRADAVVACGSRLHGGEGVRGRVVASGQPMRLDDVDPDVLSWGKTEAQAAAIARLGLRSLVVVPLRVSRRVVGVACVGRRARRPFCDEEVRFLEDLGTHAALAISNSRLLGELRAADGRFALLAESGLLGVLVGAGDGRVIEANDVFLRWMGYSRDDLEAGRIRSAALTPPEHRAAWARFAAEIAEKGRTTPVEQELVRADGTRLPVLVGIARAEGDRYIAFVADLSERKRTERALQSSEEQLRQAQKLEAIGRLAGGVAHDFNNLLTVILGTADLALTELPSGDPTRDDLDEIRKAGQRAAELTRQLLVFSRQEAIEARIIEVGPTVGGMEKMLRRILGEDIDLALNPGPEGSTRVFADPTQIAQVVMNLVVNARDAMPTGGKLTIEVADVELEAEYGATHLGVAPGPHVMLAVSDTGIGMDRATQARIFEPFFTTKPVGTGTGLGLSTVFGIVRQAGGSIFVYSEPGQGTTFKIYLPRAEGATTEVKPAVAANLLRGTETVLLVEDEMAVRSVARAILKRYGYRVIEARNAGDAMLVCEQRGAEIDLLLTDVVMPGMGGPELARRIVGPWPKMRVICMSGYTDDAVVRHGLVGSGMAFLQKPLTPEKLARKLREVLDGPRS